MVVGDMLADHLPVFVDEAVRVTIVLFAGDGKDGIAQKAILAPAFPNFRNGPYT